MRYPLTLAFIICIAIFLINWNLASSSQEVDIPPRNSPSIAPFLSIKTEKNVLEHFGNLKPRTVLPTSVREYQTIHRNLPGWKKYNATEIRIFVRSSSTQAVNTSKSNNLIVAWGVDADITQLSVFVTSLRIVSQCDVVMFVNHLEKALQDKLSSLRIQLVMIQADTWPYLMDASVISSSDASHIPPPPIQTSNLKFFISRLWIKKLRQEYRNVLVSDVSSVVFQHDPFAAGPLSSVYVAEHYRSSYAEHTPISDEWLEFHANAEVGLVKPPFTVDSGIILGPIDAVLTSIELWIQLTKTVTDLVHDVSDRLWYVATYYNMNNATYPMTIWPNGFGRVRSLRYEGIELLENSLLSHPCNELLAFDKDLRILNEDSSLPFVLHGYDMIPCYGSHVQQRFRNPF